MSRGLVIFLISVAMAACYTPRYVHSPAAHNVPLFEKKNETKLGLYYSSVIGNRNSLGSRVDINRSSGLDFQFAYALDSRWFIESSWYHRKEVNDGDYSYLNLDSTVIRYSRNLYELGIGHSFRHKADDKFVFQLTGGIALGRYEFTDKGKDISNNEFSRYFRTRVLKVHFQPAMIYKMKSWLTNVISSRFSMMNFSNAQTNYSGDELNNFKLDSIGIRPAIFWEPAIVNTIGFKKIPGLKIEIQAGLSLLATKNFVDSRPFNLSAGVVLDPGKLFHKVTTVKKTRDSQISPNL